MDRLLNWSIGTVAVLALAMLACGRSEKLPKPSTESSARGSTSPETGSVASTGTPAAASAATSTTTPSTMSPVGATTTAATGQVAPTQAGLPVAAIERTFIAEAAASGLAEIDAGRMMAARSTDPGIKSYARQLEREHMSANDELKRIAEGKGIVVPAIVSKETRELLDRLRGMPAAEGDRTFVREFGIETHNKAIQLFEKEAREGQDPQLRAFAEQTLPRLREHLTMAQQLQRQGKVTTH
ncbi:DUF4142 domain-containing protein [Dechloromonas sp. XY25]|uniref:DUF4142 domain-containing protein n=1 Tax=Dechloromonas hankyongensis TaxID=2908002 RepID=A0ABS9K6F3_9RHOO|nr:DUF4142 domain-containing protein [Dechloromonas hankyongensis]MCG2578743.1 DUF4142 domain-containing protein [Dechloromonas hankyongensis]